MTYPHPMDDKTGFEATDTEMGLVTESIFSGSVIVPLADVQHIESWAKHSIPGIKIITKHTRWDFEHHDWSNSIWISDPEAIEFRRAWCRYRSELEASTLMDLTPDLPLVAEHRPDREYDPNMNPCDDAEFGMKP